GFARSNRNDGHCCAIQPEGCRCARGETFHNIEAHQLFRPTFALPGKLPELCRLRSLDWLLAQGCGSMAWAASPNSARRPLVQDAKGLRSYKPHQKQVSTFSNKLTTRGSHPSKEAASSSRSPIADHDSIVSSRVGTKPT